MNNNDENYINPENKLTNNDIRCVCPKCGSSILENHKFCTSCGSEVEAEDSQSTIENKCICKNCGTTLEPGHTFCFSCGCKVDSDVKNKKNSKKKKTKKFYLIVSASAVVIITGIIIAICLVFFPSAKSLDMVVKSINLNAGSTQQLHYAVKPYNISTINIRWSSSNDRIATVDKEGNVTALAEGVCKITLELGGKSASTTIIVSGSNSNFSFLSEFSSYSSNEWCTVGTDYISLDSNPYNYDADSYNFKTHNYSNEVLSDVNLINSKLGFNSSLVERMNHTNALSGVQSEENSDYKVTWSYHPDNDLEITYSKK